jgi:8-oxo-dGTP pyrophosphatase MutT (NUDIX family)
MTAVPPDLRFDVERTSVRVVLRDGVGSVLLFHTVDPWTPSLGSWWELPGGGVEPGEAVPQTAARELAEETGLVVEPGLFGPATWTRAATYLRRGRRTLQHEVVVPARVAGVAPWVGPDGRTDEELEDYVGHRWWPVPALQASGERFFPGRLPELIAPFLSGARIDEPFEQWN